MLINAKQVAHETVDVALPFVEPRTERVTAVDCDTGEPVKLGLTSRFSDALQKLGLMGTMGCLRLARREVRTRSRARNERDKWLLAPVYACAQVSVSQAVDGQHAGVSQAVDGQHAGGTLKQSRTALADDQQPQAAKDQELHIDSFTPQQV